MIGQINVLKQIDRYTPNNFPRFIVITGQKGQGKKTLAREIAKKLSFPIVSIQTKIDDIRDMIDTAYRQTSPIIYLLADADDMSLGAKNSLLKIIEEPPQQAYFIMTLEQMENTLSTIKSRCQEIKLEEYTDTEKQQMINELLPNATSVETKILHMVCNYEQKQKLVSYGVTDFYNYVFQVYNHIHTVQSANSFKLAEKLDLKNDGNGYDLELFFILFTYFIGVDIYDSEDMSEVFHLYNGLAITTKYKNMLSIKGINRQMLIDNWILDIRKEWQKLW